MRFNLYGLLALSLLLVGCGSGSKDAPPGVALVHYVSNGSTDLYVPALRAELDRLMADNVYRFEQFDAGGDFATLVAITDRVTSGGYDVVASLQTVALQALAKANDRKSLPQVFGMVVDPVVAGVGFASANQRPQHLTGVLLTLPIDAVFKTAKRMSPSLDQIGTLYNPSEANSEAWITQARTSAEALGITLDIVAVSASTEVRDAVGALADKDVDAVLLGADATVLSAAPVVIERLAAANIPVISAVPRHAAKGALFDLGPDHQEGGKAMAALIARLLQGEPVAGVTPYQTLTRLFVVNNAVLAKQQGTWRLPDDLKAEAEYVD